ncbi:MAG: hypothetical protein ACYS99_19145 [Planctomycetota bacterium]
MRPRPILLTLLLTGTVLAARAEVDTTRFHPEPTPGHVRYHVFQDLSRQIYRHAPTDGTGFIDHVSLDGARYRRESVFRDTHGLHCTSSIEYPGAVVEDYEGDGYLVLPRLQKERKRHRMRALVSFRALDGPDEILGEGRLRYTARIRKREPVTCRALGEIYAYRVDFKLKVKGRVEGARYRRKAKWSGWFSTLDGIVKWRDREQTKLLETLIEVAE